MLSEAQQHMLTLQESENAAEAPKQLPGEPQETAKSDSSEVGRLNEVIGGLQQQIMRLQEQIESGAGLSAGGVAGPASSQDDSSLGRPAFQDDDDASSQLSPEVVSQGPLPQTPPGFAHQGAT